MKNFIVPVDFSAESLNGIHMAVLFSKQHPVNIQMVYVQKSSADFHPGSFEEEFRYAEIQFKKLVSEIEPKLGEGSKIKYIIKKGIIYKEVVNQAESYMDAVISASTHGASGFEEFFVGSNTYKILSATSKPVLTIRNNKCPNQIKKIVVPLKMHVDTRQKVPFAADIAELFGAEIHLISISTSQNKRITDRLTAYMNQSSNYLRKRRIDHLCKQFHGENLVSLAANYAAAIDADLVVIMSEKGGGWNALLGNYAHEMINVCPIPVLSIKCREKHIPSGFRTFGG
jgi:nucleotide-binding universal stress UspA family protein